MQRVVRSSLVGLLTIAGLAACGDKVTVPPPISQQQDNTVHQVIVSPNTVNMQVGQKVTLAASVDAGAGVTVRTVTWSSSNTAVVTVDGTGIVTAVGPGTATVLAAATADPNVKGASAITVGGGGTPSVSIASTNTTVCGLAGCNSVPANLSNFGTAAQVGATGQLDVTVNVDANGNTMKSVQGTLTCAGKTLTASQSLSVAPTAGADENAAPVALTFQTAAFNATTGAPALFNTGAFNVKDQTTPACTLQVSASPTSGPDVKASAQSVTLNNADVAIVSTKTSNPTSAADANGLPWFGGDVTISALPVLYSQRTATSLLFNLPNANTPTQTVPAAASGTTSATWSSTSTSGPNVVQLTLNTVDAQGFPAGIQPSVQVIDAAGNSAQLPAGNPASAFSLRIDNGSPQPPLTFQVPQVQGEWVNGTYVFAASAQVNPTLVKYVSCGDAPAAPATVSPAGTNACVAAQGGVSRGTIPVDTVTPTHGNSGANPQTTLKFFAFDVTTGASVPGTLKDPVSGSVIGTSVNATTCNAASTANGWIDVTANAGALTEGPTNTRYIVRAVETDKLGNVRCTDLSNALNTINTVGAARALIGSDKTPPTVPNGRLANNNEDPTAANDSSTFGVGSTLLNFVFSASDNLSGFSSTPVLAKLTRFDAASAAACVIGNGSSCTPKAIAISAVQVDNASGKDGYYTYTASVSDLATNTTSLPSRIVLVDKTVPVMGGIQVPATISGGQAVNFATQATDNLDLVSSNFTLTYPITASGGPTPLSIRAQGPSLGVAFDNTLTTAASYSYTVSSFVRTLAATTAAGTPTNAASSVLPTSIVGRALDAAGNSSVASTGTITPANIPIPASGTGAKTDFTLAQSNGAKFCDLGVSTCAATDTGFVVTVPAATLVSNCPAAGCAGGVAPAHATTINLTARAKGTESSTAPAFQFLNPFPAGVSFYYEDPVSGEWILIGTVAGPSVSDNVTSTVRSFTWTFPAWDPPAIFAAPTTINIVAIGVNSLGDALATANNANISVTNP